ncbi:MAG: twin-arginine translocase TatA/TatE family subunit [Syntrophobacteraceae bacterium]|nr:twin-arginine translocase TatA/TatE family subunit [Desulfobacteraceae bacterium]
MFSMPDIAVILAVVLILFGPGKLPGIGEALGKGIRNFRKATDQEDGDASRTVQKAEDKSASPEQAPKIKE